MRNPIIIIGTGSLALLGLEIALQNDILVYGFICEKNLANITQINHIPILGNIDKIDCMQTIDKDCSVFIGIEHSIHRQQYINKISDKEHIDFINLIHPFTNLASSFKLGLGSLIDAGTTISPNVSIGNHCLIHKQVAIEYGADIQDFVQIGSGSVIGEKVIIEENTFIGPGVTIIPGIHVKKGARIGAGSIVLDDVNHNETILGNPAKPIKI